MSLAPAALRLVLVTPGRGPWEEVARLGGSALEGGVTALWVRERERPEAELRRLLLRLRDAAAPRGAALLLSGRAELAAEFGLAAVHVGFRDGGVVAARAAGGTRGTGLAVGYSAHDPRDHDSCRAADYVTLSPVFPVPSKAAWHGALGLTRFGELCRTVGRPVVGLGGIDARNAAAVVAAGAVGVAVQRAIAGAPDPARAAAELRAALDQTLPGRVADGEAP